MEEVLEPEPEPELEPEPEPEPALGLAAGGTFAVAVESYSHHWASFGVGEGPLGATFLPFGPGQSGQGPFVLVQ